MNEEHTLSQCEPTTSHCSPHISSVLRMDCQLLGKLNANSEHTQSTESTTVLAPALLVISPSRQLFPRRVEPKTGCIPQDNMLTSGWVGGKHARVWSGNRSQGGSRNWSKNRSKGWVGIVGGRSVANKRTADRLVSGLVKECQYIETPNANPKQYSPLFW
jgi:hypothetical protein